MAGSGWPGRATIAFLYQDKVQIWDQGFWSGTYRVVSYSGGSSLILEQGDKLTKFPTCLVRPLNPATSLEVRAESIPSEDEADQPSSSSPNVLWNDTNMPPVIKEKSRKDIPDEIWISLDLDNIIHEHIPELPAPKWETDNAKTSRPLHIETIYLNKQETEIGAPQLSSADPYEQVPLSEQEEQLLTGHDLSRLPPRIFRKIPDLQYGIFH